MPAERQPNLEQLYRQFLHIECAIGLSYARLATTAYAAGHVTPGERLASLATHAMSEVGRWLNEAEAQAWDVSDLSAEQDALRAALVKLPPPLPVAA